MAGDFRNNERPSVPGGTFPDCSMDYYADQLMLLQPVVANNWWVSGGVGTPHLYPVTLEKWLEFNNGQLVKLTETGTIYMRRPNGKITATTSSVMFDYNYKVASDCNDNLFGLHFGIPTACNGVPGIRFVNSSTVGWGDFQWVQVVTSFLVQYQANDSTGLWLTKRGGPLLDPSPVGYAYNSNPQETEDSPGANVDPPFCLSKALSDTRNFEMYLEFRPPNGHWVPLRKVSWNYSGHAVADPPICWVTATWALSSPPTWSENPLDVDAQQYPVWTNQIPNIQWQWE